MRKIALIFSVLIICLAFCSCSEKAPANGEMTAVKDEGGMITGYERKYYNDDGKITRWDIYDADEVYQKYVVYTYDSDGRLTQETTYRADGIGDFYYTYVYDTDGNLTEKGYYTQSKGAVRTLYDKSGNECERYEYDETDQLISHKLLKDGDWIDATEPSTELLPTE